MNSKQLRVYQPAVGPTSPVSSLTRTYLRPYRLSVVAASLCSLALGLIATGVVTLVGPCLQVLVGPADQSSHRLSDLLGARLGGLVADVLGQATLGQEQLLVYLPLALLALALVKACVYTSQSFLWERLGELVSRDLRRDLLGQFVYLDPSARKDQAARAREQELASVVSTDIKLMREYLVHFYGGLPRELIQMLFMMATLLLLSPKLFMLFFLAVAPAVALVQRLGRKLRRRAGQALADYSLLSEWLQQRLLGVETIKHYQSEGIETAKFRLLTSQLYQQFFKAARIKARTSPMIELVALVALVLVLLLALDDIAEGRLSGAIAISFFATLAMVSQSAAMVGRYFNSNREGAAAIGRIEGLLNFARAQARRELHRPQAVLPAGVILRCQAVSVQYPEANAAALADFTFDFVRGKSYALVGPSGAGKSSLFNVILGLQAPARGQLHFQAEAAVAAEAFIGYMPQQVQLMSASIAENIAYPEVEADAKRIEEALREVQLADFVSQLPAGIHSQVGSGGVGFSGGQAQRVLLARLLYHRFPLVLVDEGTSALDPELEQQIFGLLGNLQAGGATIVMIAHRRSAISFADEVITLQGGRQVANALSH